MSASKKKSSMTTSGSAIPYKIYTLEWPLEKLNEMQQLVQNYPSVNLSGPQDEGPKERIIAPSFIQKWQRYVQLDVNEYSATSEWVDAQKQHIDLMKKIPLSCRDVLDLGCGDGWSTNQLRQLEKNAIGVTINPKEADHAVKDYGLQLVVCDMHDLTMPDCCFDMMYCRECYEHSVAPYIARQKKLLHITHTVTQRRLWYLMMKVSLILSMLLTMRGK